MVICRFFQQGSCKFGSNCRNEHTTGETLVNRQAVPDINVLVNSVQVDNLNAEKGGQWLLSSYAPFKEKPAIPGFEDKSFEEVRYEFYQAKISGQIDQYNQQLQSLLQNVLMKIRALQNPSPDVINLIKQIYNSPPNYASTNTANVFEKPPAATFTNNSIFGGTTAPQTPSGSIFGGQTTIQPAVPFNSGNIFAGSQPNQGNIFGGQGNTPFGQGNNSPFGGSNNSPFGTSQAINSPFGIPQVTTTNSPFGVPQVTTTNSPFGVPQVTATNSPFGVPQVTTTNSPFGVPQVTATNSPFGVAQVATTNSPFGIPQTAPTNSPLTHANSPFGVPPTTSNSPFVATQPNNSTLFSAQYAPSGTTPFQTPSSFANPQSLNTNSSFSTSLYSKLKDLSQDEINIFQSAKFEMGKIPEKPPPIELC